MSTNIFKAVRTVARSISGSFERGANTTLAQYLALAAIGDTGNLKQVEIGAITGIDRSTLSTIVKHLVRDGFVTTETDPADGRATRVKLTTEGRKHLRKLDRRAERMSAKLCASEEAATKLVADLTNLAAKADEAAA